MKNVLAIQSHVVYGFACNKSATFPMQLLGVDVWALNTVQFSNHTQYGKWTGMVIPQEQIGEIANGLDAIGKTIAKEKAIQDTLGKNEKADKVLFVIITDGLENASREYNSATVKKLIETQKEKYGWEFLFLGANIDAIETANTIGISAERAVNYKSDSIGTKKNYDTLNKAVEEVRSGKDLDKNWKADIEADYNERNKK